MKNVIVYKGIPLTNGRTEKMIDTIIEKRGSMKTNEIAELLGMESFRPVNAICRLLNSVNGTTAKAPKKPFKPVREAKNTYTNYCGTAKEKARNLIADAIMETKRQSSNILTLPAAEWMMEKNIMKKKPGYKFTAVLDYCGFIDTFFNEIDDIMNRKLVKKGGYITLTFSENDRVLNHSHHTSNHSHTYIQNCCVEGEEINGNEVTTGLIKFLVYKNAGYKLESKFSYKDNTVKMMLFIIKRLEN